MKFWIAISLLSLSSGLFARATLPTSLTATAADTDSVPRSNAYIWGQRSDGSDSRARIDTAGNLNVVIGGSGGASQSVTLSAIAGTAATANFDKITTNAERSANSQLSFGARVLDNAGAAFGVTANPIFVTVSGGTLGAISGPLPAGTNLLGNISVTGGTLGTISIMPLTNIQGTVGTSIITGTAATSWYDKLTWAANVLVNGGNAGLAVSVTATNTYSSVSQPVFVVLSSTATAVSLTGIAGVGNVDFMISTPGPAVMWKITNSLTSPTDLSTRGFYLAPSTTVKDGPYIATGQYLHFYSLGAVAAGSPVTVGILNRLTSTANP